jgi:hypothetical protein
MASGESTRVAGSTGLRNNGPEPDTSGNSSEPLEVEVDELSFAVVEVDDVNSEVPRAGRGAVVAVSNEASEQANANKAGRVIKDQRINGTLITP